MQQALRDAAEQQAGHRRVAARPDRDQIGADLLGDFCDRVSRPVGDRRDEVQGGLRATAVELFDLLAHLRLELVLVGVDRVTAGPPGHQLAHVHHLDLRSVLLRELLSDGDGAIG
jgi:hypothetical protein